VPQAPGPSDKRELEKQPAAGADPGAGTLVIGRQIVLSGEVTSCNRLVVEGTIKANIKECRDIAIAEGGLFSGSAAVQSADISGRFEGDLTVSGRLLIRALGLVSGTVQYRELEIERGGRIAGNVSASSSGSGST
jgi:cytoskeletal protein CcmA (bactofilin family)